MNSLQTTLQQEHLAPQLIDLVVTLLAITRTISEKVGMGALGDSLGVTSETNVQGEVQKKLDIIANNLLVNELSKNKSVRAIASEEEQHTILVTAGAPYLVAFDPLDGSTNIDINAQIGTIFTIFAARNDVADDSEEQFFQSGHHQLCAGYVLYGPYTTLAITAGRATHEFTLNKISGEFILSKPNMIMPRGTCEFAANMSNLFYWPNSFQTYIQQLIAKKVDGPRFNMRWQGAMVADIHRILTRGGVFIYPSDCRDSNKPAKLRLLYEAFPMALLVEAAGGEAYSEAGKILSTTLTSLHQRTPVIIGDGELVSGCYQALLRD
ncbi:MAG: class 1 fructose-bisphosphatase [Pseudomonadota bacterium]